MTRRTIFKGTTAARRRERLKAAAIERGDEAREEVVSSEKLHRPTPSRVVLQCKRKPTGKLPGVTMKAARREVKEFRNQIIRATYLYEHEFGRGHSVDGSICLPEIAIYHAGHRNTKSVTAR